MPTHCCIYQCTSWQGKEAEVSFFRFPVLSTKIKDHALIQLIKERQIAWAKAISRKNLKMMKNARVCSKHFISGKSAKIKDNLNPDWAPSINMGYENKKKTTSDLRRYNRTVQRSLQRQNNDIASDLEVNAIEMEINNDKTCQTEDFYLQEANLCFKDHKYLVLQQKYETLKKNYEAIAAKELNSTLNEFKGNPRLVKYLTGIPSFTSMNVVFQHCEPYLPFSSFKMTKFDVFIMMFSKLRIDLPFTYLAYKYGVSLKTVSRLFHKALVVVHRRLSCFVFWPDELAHKQNTPQSFKKVFGNGNIFIMDCFEIFCERPGKRLAAASTFSHYKHHQTLKYLICISSFGSITFVSKGYGGRCSDKYITENCGVLNFIKENDIIMVDRGFLIASKIKEKKARLIMPAFKNGKKQLEPFEIENNREIASLRIHVERVIGTLRSKYLITTQRQPITAISKKIGSEMYFDYIMKVACAIVNLNSSII